MSCTDNNNEYKRKSRAEKASQKDQERWVHMDGEEFLDEVADATERDIELSAMVDTSDIVSSSLPSKDRAQAIAEALGNATALHWT